MSEASKIIGEAVRSGRKFLLEPEANIVCAEYGIPLARGGFAREPSEAVRIAEEIGYPVALKLVSPEVIHKSDVGGVFLNLKDPADVEEAYKRIALNLKEKMPKARMLGAFVQEMAEPSVEVIVGMVRDPIFGPVLMFGLGGVFVELLKDVSYRIAPISLKDASDMVKEVKAYPILKGYRGGKRLDIDSILDVLLKTSRLAVDHKEIASLDLNPIIVYEDGIKVVDAKIYISI